MQTEGVERREADAVLQEHASATLATPDFLKGLGVIFFAFLGPFWSAFVFLRLWQWFIVPLGMRDITYWHSLGLVIVVQFLLLSAYSRNDDKRGNNKNTKPDWAHWKRRLWRGNLIEAFYLFTGWLAHYGVRHI